MGGGVRERRRKEEERERKAIGERDSEGEEKSFNSSAKYQRVNFFQPKPEVMTLYRRSEN